MSKVELVGKTVGIGKYEDLNSEEIISAIARHGIIKEDNGKLVKYLMTHQHWSPLDMINYIFEIETSLSIGRQLLRHSSIKPQEHSLRYSDKISFQPIELRKEHPTNRQSSSEVFDPIIDLSEYFGNAFTSEKASEIIEELLSNIQIYYSKLIEAGVAKECARFVLPLTTQTKIYMKGSVRSWIHYLQIRCDGHTQLEHQQIALSILEIFKTNFPNISKALEL